MAHLPSRSLHLARLVSEMLKNHKIFIKICKKKLTFALTPGRGIRFGFQKIIEERLQCLTTAVLDCVLSRWCLLLKIIKFVIGLL